MHNNNETAIYYPYYVIAVNAHTITMSDSSDTITTFSGPTGNGKQD